MQELRVAFDSPPRYGKSLDWTGYTEHDAANTLLRYLLQLPEPLVPPTIKNLYERFREPLQGHQAQAVGPIEGQRPCTGDFDHRVAIDSYQSLITNLPPLNRQLLLYIMDLLAVFASKSDHNKMTTPKLAALFQPGIIAYPDHRLIAEEVRLSQDVLIFLIENQDDLLVGMQCTTAKEDIV